MLNRRFLKSVVSETTEINIMAVKHRQTEEMKRAKYECDGCGKIDFWNDDWFWFGSIIQKEDEPQLLLTVCSNECKNKFNHHGKLKTY